MTLQSPRGSNGWLCIGFALLQDQTPGRQHRHLQLLTSYKADLNLTLSDPSVVSHHGSLSSHGIGGHGNRRLSGRGHAHIPDVKTVRKLGEREGEIEKENAKIILMMPAICPGCF